MITATIKGLEKDKELEFPKLMKGKITGVVVLFLKPTEGTVIIEGGTYNIGEHQDEFIMSKFEDFKEELTLKNK